MPSKTIFQSAGQISQHIIPGVFSRIDSVKGSSSYVSANNGVIIGQGYGLKPATLYKFSNSPDALNSIYGGPLREAARLSFDPGNDYVPQYLYFMAVNTATQSSYDLLKSSSARIRLTSKQYGLHTKQIKVKIEAGTTGKKLTIVFKSNSESFDNLTRDAMTIQYTAGACTLTITNTSATKTIVSSAGGLSLNLADYPTMGELAAAIADVTGFTCEVAAGQDDVASTELDQVSAIDINTAAVTLKSDMYYIMKVVNEQSSLVEATDVSTTNGVAVPDNLSAYVRLTGGTNGSYTATEWSAALTALEAEDVQHVATPDTSASVHAAVSTHCTSMSSTVRKKERQFVVGFDWATTVADAKTKAKALNTKWGMAIYNGFKQYDEYGTLTEFDSSYAACMVMAMKCAAAINMPLTCKQLNVISLEAKLKDSDLEGLLMAGVCPINYDESGIPSVVRQLTTYQADDLKYNEYSMVTEMSFVSRDLRNYLKGLFIGNPGVKGITGVIEGAVKSRLSQYVDLGIFTADSTGRTFWNIIVRLSGDVVYVDYNANITAPINFIFVTQHFSEAMSLAEAA